MSERPFMQLYVSDFIGDTLHLSAELVGAYLLLLMAMWNADGELPDDEAKLARIARVSLKKWRAMTVDLMPFFTVEKGKITHGRLQKELQKSERQSQSRASAGARGGAAKALKYNKPHVANALAMPKHLPEPYRKEGNVLSDPTATITVDRWKDEALFKACERLKGKAAPATVQKWSFPAAIVEQARRDAAH